MRNSKELASEAIDAAKPFWPIKEGEPKISNVLVQLRELCYALELLLGNIPQEEGNWVDTDAYLYVLEALKDGGLVARSFATDTIIPSYSWSFNNAETGPEAYDSIFWYGVISRDEDCRGFRGQLPVIAREVAEEWLATHIPPCVKRPTLSNAEAKRQFHSWIKEFDEPEKPTQVERWAWGRERGLSRDFIRELVRLHAPNYWSLPGAKKKIGNRTGD